MSFQRREAHRWADDIPRLFACEDIHPLSRARFHTSSLAGTLVYVVCVCGRRKAVPAGEWQAELARRAQEVRGG